MKLYDLDVSGNCYKVRLLLSMLEIPHETVAVDFVGGEHKRDPLLGLNPFAEIPVLVDGDVTLRDSQAILVYLARREERTDWLPIVADEMGDVVQWLMVAESEIARGPNDARLHDKFGYELDVDAARAHAERVMTLVEERLDGRSWLCCGRATVADIACFPYIALSHEGGLSLRDYPRTRAWIERIVALPGFVSMPALEGGLA